MEKRYIVDESGEILKVIEDPNKYIELEDGDKVIRGGKLAFFSETTDIKYYFIKINPLLYGKMANKYPILNDLIEYTEYMTNELRYQNGKPIKIKSLPKITKRSESTIKRQLKGLISEDVIHKVKDDSGKMILVVNPYVAMRGRRIYLSLYEEFKSSALRTEIEEWGK